MSFRIIGKCYSVAFFSSQWHFEKLIICLKQIYNRIFSFKTSIYRLLLVGIMIKFIVRTGNKHPKYIYINYACSCQVTSVAYRDIQKVWCSCQHQLGAPFPRAEPTRIKTHTTEPNAINLQYLR